MSAAKVDNSHSKVFSSLTPYIFEEFGKTLYLLFVCMFDCVT